MTSDTEDPSWFQYKKVTPHGPDNQLDIFQHYFAYQRAQNLSITPYRHGKPLREWITQFERTAEAECYKLGCL